MSREYRGWTIEYNPKPIPIRCHDWQANFDEEPMLTGSSPAEVMRQVDAWYYEQDYVDETLTGSNPMGDLPKAKERRYNPKTGKLI